MPVIRRLLALTALCLAVPVPLQAIDRPATPVLLLPRPPRGFLPDPGGAPAPAPAEKPAPADPPPATPKAISIDEPTPLGARLPAALTSKEPYELAPEGGIRAGGTVRTVLDDLLLRNQNFVFDVWFAIDAGQEARVGLGDGRTDQSIGLQCRYGGRDAEARLFPGDHAIGRMPEPGVYVFRVERHGGPMTLSVGVERAGRLDFYGALTVQDPRRYQNALDPRITPLYFNGSALFKQVRFRLLPATPAAAQPGDRVVPFDRDLAAPFTATGPFETLDGGGIRLRRGSRIESVATDHFEKDFVFDVWFTPPVGVKDWTTFGVGDGSLERSITMSARAENERSEAVLTAGDHWHGPKMGRFRVPGDYVGRIEKRGASVVFSLGTADAQNRFTALYTHVIPDPRAFNQRFEPRWARLYLEGGASLKQYRLVTTAAGIAAVTAAPPATVAAPPANVGATTKPVSPVSSAPSDATTRPASANTPTTAPAGPVAAGAFDWQRQRAAIRYEHDRPTYSRAGYAPYIDEPPTRLLDGLTDSSRNQVGWQYAKPNLIRFTFPAAVRPAVIRLWFRGNEKDREVNVPRRIYIYDGLDPATRRELGHVVDLPNRTGWVEVPLSGASDTFVIDLQQHRNWTVLGEVEFR
jgi:hypothetical protein